MSDEVRAARRRLGLRAAGAGLVWSLGLLLTAVLVPLYDGQTSTDANGLTLSTATYVQRYGAWVLIPLLAALLAAVAAVLAVTRPAPALRRAALAAAAGVTVLGLVLVTNGGILLAPVAIALGVALRLTRPAPPGPRPGSGRAHDPGARPEPKRPRSRSLRRSAPGAES